jgi:hypothetical protein
VVKSESETKFTQATQNAATSAPGAPGTNPDYEKMAQATVHKDWVQFMRDSFLQKATSAAHNYFCEQGLDVADGNGGPVFRSTATTLYSTRRVRKA